MVWGIGFQHVSLMLEMLRWREEAIFAVAISRLPIIMSSASEMLAIHHASSPLLSIICGKMA